MATPVRRTARDHTGRRPAGGHGGGSKTSRRSAAGSKTVASRFTPSEVKDPVTDRLKRSHSLQELTGKVHLKEYNAVASVNPDLARRTLEAQ